MQRGFAQLLLVLVLIILILSGGYFYLSSKKSPENLPPPQAAAKTASINTYSNKELGFKFIVPQGLTAKVDSEEEFNKRGNGDFRKNFNGYVGYEPPVFLGTVVVLSKDNNFDNNPVSIWVFNNDNNLTVEQWFANYWYYPFVWGVFDYASKSKITMDQEATVSGELARSKIVEYQLGKPKYIYLAKNSRMYLVRIINDSKNTGNQILSTFKFIK